MRSSRYPKLPLFPMFLRLAGRSCLVAGAGNVAEEKIRGLLEARARVRVIAPSATALISKLAREKKVATPIIDEVYALLYEGKEPKKAVRDLISRAFKAED